jgi:hypothetical protein
LLEDYKLSAPAGALTLSTAHLNHADELWSQFISSDASQILFDPEYYCAQMPGRQPPPTPLDHFRRDGVEMRLNPHPLFDTKFYLQTYPDVAAAGVNPLAHFFRYAYKPNPLFDCDSYRYMYLALVEENPLVHYIREGDVVGNRPHLYFSPTIDHSMVRAFHGGRRRWPTTLSRAKR